MKKATKKPAKRPAPKPAKTPKPCLSILVLDASGSMQPFRADVINGVNSYVAELSKGAPDAAMTLVRFSTTVLPPRTYEPASTLRLYESNYMPDGFTALFDAVLAAISEGDIWLGANKGGRVTVTIYTDGVENNSKAKQAEVIGQVSARTAKGWEFVYLGAVADAWGQGKALGVPSANTYSADPGQVAPMMAAVAGATMRAYAGGQSVTMSFGASPQLAAAGLKKAKQQKK